MPSKSFKKWLKEQTRRNDPVGDLSRDATLKYLAKETPDETAGLQAWIKYLEKHSACNEAFEALNAAWREYQEMEVK